MHWNLCCTAVYSACNHHRTTCHHRTTYYARHHLYFCNFAVAGSVVNQSNLFYFNVLFHVAGRPSVCVRQATYVLLIFFFYFDKHFTHFPYLPGSHSWSPFCEQALAVMCLWWRLFLCGSFNNKHNLSCSVEHSLIVNAQYHVLVHIPTYIHTYMYIHTYTQHTIWFSFFKIEIWITWTFFLVFIWQNFEM